MWKYKNGAKSLKIPKIAGNLKNGGKIQKIAKGFLEEKVKRKEQLKKKQFQLKKITT